MNRRTKTVNRILYFSWDIQIVENLITFAEMNRTTEENDIPIGSIISVRMTGVEDMWNIIHSRRKIC